MRGETEPQATMLMRLAPDGFVLRGAPAAADQAAGRLGVGSHVAVVRRSLRGRRAALDPARAAAQGKSVDGLLHDPLGASVLRVAALQHPLQVVPGPQRQGRALPPDDVHEEPRAAAGGGRGAGCSRKSCVRRPAGGCSRPTTSRSTARCTMPWPRTRVSSARRASTAQGR